MAKYKKRNKHMRRFKVEVLTTVVIDLDDRLTPDDEWRSQFYNLHGLDGVARHVAYNIAANGAQRINQLDGFADRPATMLDVHAVEAEVDDVYEL